MVGEAGVVDRLVVAVTYAYDQIAASEIARDFQGLIGLATGVAGALVGITVASAHAGDEAIKHARSVNLEVEAYTELAYAADMAGVSQEQLGAGLNVVTRQLFAATHGGKEAQKVFSTLGLDPRQFEDSADALPHIADALNAITDEGERAGLELQLFGRSGGELRSFLVGGSADMERMGDRAHALGVTISEVDALASEHLMDSLSDLGSVATGLARNIGFGLVPPMTRVVDGALDWYLANSKIIDQQMDRVVGGLARGLDLLNTPMGRVVAGGVAVAGAWGAFGAVRSLGAAASAASPLAGALLGQAAGAWAVVRAGGPLALVLAGTAGVLDDVYAAARGDDSILLRLGRTMGAEGEMQKAAGSFTGMLGEVGSAAWDVGAAMVGGIGYGLDYIADHAGPAKEAVESLAKVFREADWGGAIDFIGDRFDDIATGAGIIGRGARGESTDVDRMVTERFNAAWSSTLFGSSQETRATQAGALVNMTINPQTGMSATQIADLAAEQARTEVYRQTREALAALGMSE